MKNRFIQMAPLAAGIAVMLILVGITVMDSSTKQGLEDQLVSKCSPILSEFDRIQEVRNQKRQRFESLLVQQEEGLIPFNSDVVDYEYRTWMVQDTELDRRGDGLIQELSLLDCQSVTYLE